MPTTLTADDVFTLWAILVGGALVAWVAYAEYEHRRPRSK